MKYCLFFFLFLSPFLVISQTDANKVTGIWLTENKDAKVKIYQKNGKYCGKVIWIKEPNDADGNPLTDKKNPDNKLKSRVLLNLNIITNLTYEKNKWTGGKIYDPKNGDPYDCTLWIEDHKLKVRGYWGWLYDTKTWTRIS